MTESEIQNAILLKFGRESDLTLWRQNTGTARTEVATRAHLERLLSMLNLNDWDNARSLLRALLAEKPRFTAFGLCRGSSDIIGIVQSMASAPGVFLALEVKAANGKLSNEQRQFLALVNRRGGVGREVRSVEDAGRAIDEARQR